MDSGAAPAYSTRAERALLADAVDVNALLKDHYSLTKRHATLKDRFKELERSHSQCVAELK